MLRAIVPKNARSKRVQDARAPKEIEDERTAIFVRGTHTGEVVNGVMKDLLALKRPNGISFSKKNTIHPFEPTGTTSLEFWSTKNDAGIFVVGLSTKKRPDGLTFVRMYDGKVLDMCEVGVKNYVTMSEFKTPKSTPGHKPMLHFASPLFDTHPRFTQLKGLLIALFNGEAIDSIALQGLEHVISVTLSPLPSPNTPLSNSVDEDVALLPIVHIRAYTMALKASGSRVPYIDLVPMGPSFDLVLRRHQQADPIVLAQAMKRPKMAKKDVEKGLGDKKKMRNKEVDEMGDLRGRVHLGKQDLSKLQTRKMKGLKKGAEEDDGDEEMGEVEDDGDDDDEVIGVGMDLDEPESPRKKRRKD